MKRPTPSIGKSDRDTFSRIPSVFDREDCVFESVDDLQLSLRALVRILGRKNSSKRSIPSYLLEDIVVEFSVHFEHESVHIDHASSKILIRLPKTKRESEATLEYRRRECLRQYLAVSEELRTRGLIQAHRALGKRARKRLIDTERKLQASTKKVQRGNRRPSSSKATSQAK